jgi:enamine deaminase RidA (YjgF/YER057c/UK114 family)
MKQVIDTGLASVSAPISWATVGNGILFTAQIPFDHAGKLVPGDIRDQTRQTLRNLQKTLAAAGGTLDDVTQVVVYLVNLADFEAMNEVYREFFKPPYPNRATIGAGGLAVPDMKVEMLAYAALTVERGAAGKGAKQTGRARGRPTRGAEERRRQSGR